MSNSTSQALPRPCCPASGSGGFVSSASLMNCAPSGGTPTYRTARNCGATPGSAVATAGIRSRQARACCGQEVHSGLVGPLMRESRRAISIGPRSSRRNSVNRSWMLLVTHSFREYFFVLIFYSRNVPHYPIRSPFNRVFTCPRVFERASARLSWLLLPTP